MLEEKWNNMYCYEVFNKDGWSIHLRSRCNQHPGEPDMKVWVMFGGTEIAQYTSEFRGYGAYLNHEELLPNAVRKCAKKAWKKLCEGRYTEENLEKCRARFIEKHLNMSGVRPATVAAFSSTC